MDMGYFNGQMEENMKDNGPMEINTVKGYI